MFAVFSLALAAELGPLAGQWVFAGGDAERAAVAEVVEGGAQRFNFALRGFARSKLVKITNIDDGVVKLSGFGKFEVCEKSSRKGRNPATGEPMQLDARRVVVFRPSRDLRTRMTRELAP